MPGIDRPFWITYWNVEDPSETTYLGLREINMLNTALHCGLLPELTIDEKSDKEWHVESTRYPHLKFIVQQRETCPMPHGQPDKNNLTVAEFKKSQIRKPMPTGMFAKPVQQELF